MNLLKLFKKREKRNAIGLDGWTPIAGTASGFAASPYYAENLSAVYACVQAVSSAIGALPVFIYRKGKKARHEATEHELLRLVECGPNQCQTWPDFIEFVVAQVLLFGNCLIEVIYEDGVISGLRPIPWQWVSVQMLRSGRLVYEFSEQPGVFGATGQRRRLLDSDVIHLRDRSDDGIIGKSRLQRAAATLKTAQAVNQHAENQFSRGMAPGGILTTPTTLTSEAKAMIRQNFEPMYSGSANAGRLLLLPGPEFDFKSMHTTPEDAELLASRKFTTEEIARIFQVPPPLIQDYSHNTFTNSEQAGKWFAQFSLLPWVRKIEAAFNRALFPGGDYELVLDMSGFDRGSPETRWQAHSIAVDKGILSIDEVREIEGYGPRVDI